MTALSENFTEAEFGRSQTATREGIDNSMPADHLASATHLAVAVLQPLRDAVKRAVRITSGYRSAALNAAINGSTRSQHMKGEAADIKVDGWSAKALASLIIELGLPFDQVIWYAPERGGHVHVSAVRRGNPRGDVRHAPAIGGYPRSTLP